MHNIHPSMPNARARCAARVAGTMLCAGLALLPARAGEPLSLHRASVHPAGGIVQGGPWRARVAVGQPEFMPDGAARGGALEITGGVLVRALDRPDALFADGFDE